MHELCIAMSLIDVAEEHAIKLNARVIAIHLRLGPLSGVVKEALLGSYEMAREGTLLQTAELQIEEIPIIARCDTCQQDVTIASMQEIVCPICGVPTPNIIGGRELEVSGLEIVDDPDVTDAIPDSPNQ